MIRAFSLGVEVVFAEIFQGQNEQGFAIVLEAELQVVGQGVSSCLYPEKAGQKDAWVEQGVAG